ncbi:hypothetical protein MPSEU_000391200 [Mayamaea pseudoterrestris]|nr:hypothetical protein MPSEU_000391200 [Mayamaea pseudoterrestris]
MSSCVAPSQPIRFKPAFEPHSLTNQRATLRFDGCFHCFYSKKSSSEYSMTGMKLRTPTKATVTPTRMAAIVTPCSSSTGSFSGVSASSLSSQNKHTPKSILRSSISISEDGAEVVLCDRGGKTSAYHMITPRRLSLLDVEMTPSPLKSSPSLDDISLVTPRKVSFCGLGDCPSYSPMSTCTKASPCSDADIDDETVEHMQQKISDILSINSCDNPWLSYWQVWGLYCDDSSNNGSTRHQDAKAAKKNIQRVLRNRAFDLNAKHQRLASLRKDLSPFSTSAESLSGTIDSVRSRSFTGQDRRTRSKSTPRAATPQKQIPFFQRAFQCGLIHDSPLFVKSNKEEMFYDSDPEDFISRRHDRRFGSVADDKENAHRSGRRVSLRRDDQIAGLVQEMMNEQMTLILHENTASAKQVRPHGVHCWIERGQQLRSTIIAPKFFWKTVQTLKSSTTEKHASSYMFHSINLMDISRVLVATSETVDRAQFPFCKAKHAFFIKTLDQSLLLEANSSTERDRIVKSLRLVVARLGSLLLTNNDRLADEYFAFVDHGSLGPGEEPYWLATV